MEFPRGTKNVQTRPKCATHARPARRATPRGRATYPARGRKSWNADPSVPALEVFSAGTMGSAFQIFRSPPGYVARPRGVARRAGRAWVAHLGLVCTFFVPRGNVTQATFYSVVVVFGHAFWADGRLAFKLAFRVRTLQVCRSAPLASLYSKARVECERQHGF